MCKLYIECVLLYYRMYSEHHKQIVVALPLVLVCVCVCVCVCVGVCQWLRLCKPLVGLFLHYSRSLFTL